MAEDRDFINSFCYDLLILDEGHCIKNSSSKRFTVFVTSFIHFIILYARD